MKDKNKIKNRIKYEKRRMPKEKDETLDLDNPIDARRFILEALPEALLSAASYAILKDGTKIDLHKLSDSEAVQYAYELLPIYKARFPELVDIQYEH